MRDWSRVFIGPLLLLICAAAAPASAPAPTPVKWEHARPESVGYSSARLEGLRAYLKATPAMAMMVVVHGKVIFDYGDVARPTKIASIRKSILAILYGRYVVSGRIDLGRNVADLGLEDRQPFLPVERRATLEQLLSARSGIYLDPRDDDLGRGQPERGSQIPGIAFYYGNWEFDAAGTAFEKLTGRAIYDALAEDLAVPLEMEDFRRDVQRKIPTPTSVHPEYAMSLSARDMARIGQMMLHGGQWNGRQLVPAEWVRYTTSIVTPWEEMNPPLLRLRGAPERWGFGAGWWVWDASMFPGSLAASPFQGAFEARGSGGQYITVLPARDMVLVHKVDLDAHPDPQSGMTQQEWDAVTNLVLASACRQPCS